MPKTGSFFEAARNGHLEEMKAHLANGADINAVNGNGATALMLAAVYGHVRVVRELLAKGADVNTKASDGGTALMSASECGYLDVVRALLEAGAEINAKDSQGKSALLVASERGHGRVVQALLTKGADVDAADFKGKTAMMLAVKEDNLKIALMLDDQAKNLQGLPDEVKMRTELLDKAIHGATRSLLVWGVINLAASLFWYKDAVASISMIRAPAGTFDTFIYGGAAIGGCMLLLGAIGAVTRTSLMVLLNALTLFGVGWWNIMYDRLLDDAARPYGYGVPQPNGFLVFLGIAQLVWSFKQLRHFIILRKARTAVR